MKVHSLALCGLFSVAFSAPSFATTIITCRVPAQLPAHSEFEGQDHVFQFTHFDDGHVSGGIASVATDWTQATTTSPGPVGVEKTQGEYRYTFKVTRSWARKYGNGCGLDDSEANEGLIWDQITYAPRNREITIYSLTVNPSSPSLSHLTTSIKQECYGGLSFLGRQGHWSDSKSVEANAECILRKI